jgi:hypothetical protein
METVVVSKFIKTLQVVEGPPPSSQQANQHDTERNRLPDDMFQTGTELLYGGQGKTMCNNNLTPVSPKTCDTSSVVAVDIATHAYGGLDQPRLDKTYTEVTGDDKRLLCIQNKWHKQRLRATQTPQSHWTVHRGMVAYDSTALSQTRGPYPNSMCPTGRALRHPAAYCVTGPCSDAQQEQGATGRRGKCGRRWSEDHTDQQHHLMPSHISIWR